MGTVAMDGCLQEQLIYIISHLSEGGRRRQDMRVVRASTDDERGYSTTLGFRKVTTVGVDQVETVGNIKIRITKIS